MSVDALKKELVQLGYSYRNFKGSSIREINIPDYDALMNAYERLRRQPEYQELPALTICDSEGVASDEEFCSCVSELSSSSF